MFNEFLCDPRNFINIDKRRKLKQCINSSQMFYHKYPKKQIEWSKRWMWGGPKRWKSCRIWSRRLLKNEQLLAKIVVVTAENRPRKVCQKLQKKYFTKYKSKLSQTKHRLHWWWWTPGEVVLVMVAAGIAPLCLRLMPCAAHSCHYAIAASFRESALFLLEHWTLQGLFVFF